jgi:integrase
MHELGDWMRAVLQLESPDTRDLLIFILLTGCRRSEATQLTWNDVDLRNGIVWIGSQRRGSEYQTKTKNCHKFPLSTLLIELLRQREFSRDSSARVFPVEWPYKSIKTITRRTGITFRTHDLRRTFCNLLTHPAVNADELEVKALMNHVADVTRKHYMTVHVERLRPVMERLSQLVLYETGMPSASRNSSLLLLEDMLDVEVIEESSETLEGELVC